MEVLIDSLKDVKPILKRFGGYIRKEVTEVFEREGPGWPKRAESTEAHNASVAQATAERIRKRATSRLTIKLRKDYKRAARRFRQGKGKLSTLLVRKQVLEEFETLSQGRTIDETSLHPKQMKSLQGRLQRSVQKAEAESGRILGQIASSIVVEANSNVMVIQSWIPWSGIHN